MSKYAEKAWGLGFIGVIAAMAGVGCGNGAATVSAPGFDVMERSIVELGAALDAGEVTSRQLVTGYLARIAAYDTRGIYEAAGARGATVVIPPPRTATVSGRRPRSPARDRAIRQVQQVGRRQWKKESGYHRQGTVENAFFRYKSIIGDRLRARHSKAQEAETLIACNILNKMTALGRSASYAIGA